MENENLTQVEAPIKESNPGSFGQTDPHVVMDTGSGLSSGSDSVFGYEVSEDDMLATCAPKDVNTLPFTQMESAMLTPPEAQGFGNCIPSNTNVIPTGGAMTHIRKLFERRQARPVLVARGCNTLIPFGAYDFIYHLGTSDVTDVGNLAAVTTAMNALIPNMNTPGNYREIANWRRIFDLKNVIISYYNRSIPFTDLEASDRFALEMCYMRDIAICAMPIFAKKYAIDLVSHWQKAGFQFDVSKLQNMNSLSLETQCKQIYAAIADLPCLDEVMMERMAALTKLRVTAKKSGFTPVVMLQDLCIGGPGRYKLNATKVGSGYIVSTNFSALTGKSALNGTTFMEWVELWLRGDVISEATALETLSQYLQFAQSIRSNYSIVTAAAQQLQLKGSVKYTSIGEFLPVEGVEQFKLKYKVSGPTFNYAFKERFEYAPRPIAGEDGDGNNFNDAWKLDNLPAAPTTDYATKLVMRRPVGLYKGSQCWGTREIAQIGLWRNSILSDSNNRYEFRTGLLAKLSMTASVTQTTGINCVVVDAYYGDIYRSDMHHCATINDASPATSIAVYRNSSELVSYYGVVNSQCADFATVDTFIVDGGSLTAPLTLANGTQLLSLASYDLSTTESAAIVLIPQLTALLEQLDLTFYADNPKNDAGRTCTPVIIFTNYRGCEFDDFELAPLDNAFAESYYSLAIGIKAKTNSRDSV